MKCYTVLAAVLLAQLIILSGCLPIAEIGDLWEKGYTDPALEGTWGAEENQADIYSMITRFVRTGSGYDMEFYHPLNNDPLKPAAVVPCRSMDIADKKMLLLDLRNLEAMLAKSQYPILERIAALPECGLVMYEVGEGSVTYYDFDLMNIDDILADVQIEMVNYTSSLGRSANAIKKLDKSSLQKVADIITNPKNWKTKGRCLAISDLADEMERITSQAQEDIRKIKEQFPVEPQMTYSRRVVDESGNPVSDAEIILYGFSTDAMVYPFHNKEVGRMRTDEEGVFTVTASPELYEFSNLYLIVSKDDFAFAARELELWDNEQASDGIAEIMLEKSVSVSGVVVDQKGSLVKGANVYLVVIDEYTGNWDGFLLSVIPERTVITDKNGNFIFERVGTGNSLEFVVRADGYKRLVTFQSEDIPGQYPAGADDITLVMEDCLTVSGNVIDKDTGQPVSGLEIAAVNCGDNPIDTTYKCFKSTSYNFCFSPGQYTLYQVLESQNPLAVDGQDGTLPYVFRPIRVGLKNSDVVRDIEVERAAVVSIELKGMEYAGDSVSVYISSSQSAEVPCVKPYIADVVRVQSESGDYRYVGKAALPSGNYQITKIEKPESEIDFEPFTFSVTGGKAYDYVLNCSVSETGYVLTIVNADGSPAGGALLRYVGEKGSCDLEADEDGIINVLPDSDEYLKIKKIDGEGVWGKYIVIRNEFNNEGIADIIYSLNDKARFVLSPQSEIRGIVLDSGSNPLAHVKVSLSRDGVPSVILADTLTDSSGRFELKGISFVKEDDLICELQGYSNSVKGLFDILINGEQSGPIYELGKIEMVKERDAVYGVVIDHWGRPIPSARVATGFDPAAQKSAVLTDDYGRFRLTGVKPDGMFHVLAPEDDGNLFFTAAVKVSEKDNYNVVVAVDEGKMPEQRIDSSEVLSIKLVDEETEAPVAEAAVQVKGDSIDNMIHFKTDDKGLIRCVLPEGNYVIKTILKSGYSPAKNVLEFDPLQNAGSEIVLKLSSNPILSGVVVDQSGKPLVGANLYLFPKRLGGFDNCSSSDGSFSSSWEGIKPYEKDKKIYLLAVHSRRSLSGFVQITQNVMSGLIIKCETSPFIMGKVLADGEVVGNAHISVSLKSKNVSMGLSPPDFMPSTDSEGQFWLIVPKLPDDYNYQIGTAIQGYSYTTRLIEKDQLAVDEDNPVTLELKKK